MARFIEVQPDYFRMMAKSVDDLYRLIQPTVTNFSFCDRAKRQAKRELGFHRSQARLCRYDMKARDVGRILPIHHASHSDAPME